MYTDISQAVIMFDVDSYDRGNAGLCRDIVDLVYTSISQADIMFNIMYFLDIMTEVMLAYVGI